MANPVDRAEVPMLRRQVNVFNDNGEYAGIALVGDNQAANARDRAAVDAAVHAVAAPAIERQGAHICSRIQPAVRRSC